MAYCTWFGEPVDARRKHSETSELPPLPPRSAPKPRGRKTLPASGYVYFIQSEADGCIKIGHTRTTVQHRKTILQIGSSSRLRILGALPGTDEDERAMHLRFASLRLHHEWFSPGEELLAFIAGLPEWC